MKANDPRPWEIRQRSRPVADEPQPVVEPLVRSTIYEFASSSDLARYFASRSDRFYTRFGNPTISSAARELARLEGAEAGLLFASGMAAITTCLIYLTRSGGHVVAQRDIFAQTYSFLKDVASRFGVETTFVDATDPGNVAAAVRAETSLIFIETPSNPQLNVVDIAAVTAIARQGGIPVVVDSTFATPLLQRPLELGACLVVHSATKYLAGHSDVSCGAVLGGRQAIAEIYELQRLLGGIGQPDTAWLLQRSLKTLKLRVEAQCRSAAAIASFLEAAAGVASVHYPGLRSSPFFAVTQRQMRGGGGMVSFQVAGGLAAARAVVDHLRLIRIASSLGGAESVAEIPAELDFAAREIDGTGRGSASNVPEGLIRLSVGLENVEELIADVEQALRTVVASRRATKAK